jgi:4-alpha-glucanotransferase
MSRGAGILLHVSSLEGPHGIGDLGAGARRFADWLSAAGQTWWQFLPTNPIGTGNSPYSGASAFAGEPLTISLVDLVDEGLLEPREVPSSIATEQVDYEAAKHVRERALRLAFTRFRVGREYERFERDSVSWLDDYALFEALRRADPRPWTQWPAAVAKRAPEALAAARTEHAREIAYAKFVQFVFAQQWARLRSYCRAQGIRLIGDIPIFVAHASADVWANQHYFTLDDDGQPTHVAGVPPDYFSESGQRWGNPHYRWKRLAADGYRWWIDRFKTLLERFDLVRIDHFIGFVRYWAIPAHEATAVNGRYLRGPRAALFEAARDALGGLPFIAEDLGAVTPAVRALRDQFELPGMRVFQFGFGDDVQAAEFRPHRYPPRSIAYTGTHDNDTIMGWFEQPGPRTAEQAALERRAAIEYLAGPGATTLARAPHLEILRALYASASNVVIAPLQDVLGLSSEARMNTPGVAEGNWSWRVRSGALTSELAGELRALARIYERREP